MLYLRKLQEILSDVPDHRTRLDVASTVNYLANLFSRGTINEEQLKEELTKILVEVLDYTQPSSPEELKNRAESVAQDLIRAIKVDTVSRRVAARLRR